MTKLVRWSLTGGAAVVIAGVGLMLSSGRFKAGLEEQARRQVIQYLESRFDGKVEFQAIHIKLPPVDSLGLFFRRGRGVMASVEGNGLVLRQNGAGDLPALFRLARFRFDLDLGLLGGPVKSISRVETEGMEINIPPKGERHFTRGQGESAAADQGSSGMEVVIAETVMSHTVLQLFPRERTKIPLRFDIDRLVLHDAGNKSAMHYAAQLTNPRPPGQVQAKGEFGPWNTTEPGDTTLSGDYVFDKADLSVFKAIGGILSSTGRFSGTLDTIDVSGEARVPGFTLKAAGNPVPLTTQFEALVDGTNGNTTLKPVVARLGSTPFTTSGAIIRHEDVGKRSIDLTVHMKRGELRDLLRLAMKKGPFMEGAFNLDAKISVPPLSGPVKEKLRLDGAFVIAKGKFRSDSVQDKVDELSRRGQGKPADVSIDDVVYDMRGKFNLRDEVVRLSDLNFGVPGAKVRLDGTYDMGRDDVDFHGQLRLEAKVSQTLSGWKRWAAKPLDPFFSKDGAGTLIGIQISGKSSHPEFGRDKGDARHEPGGERRSDARQATPSR